jgi:hypothetical protein
MMRCQMHDGKEHFTLSRSEELTLNEDDDTHILW